MGFVVSEKLSLDFLGTDWHAAYIKFSLPSLKETMEQETPTEEELAQDPKRYMKPMIALLEKHFLEGKGWNGSQLVDLTASDIQELPAIAFIKASQLLSGAVIDPKS